MDIKKRKKSIFLNYIIGSGLLLVVLLALAFISTRPAKRAISSKKAIATEFSNKELTIQKVLVKYKKAVIYCSVIDDAATSLPKDIRNTFAAMKGRELSQLAFRDSYAGIIQNGQFIKEKKANEASVSLTHRGVKIESAGFTAGSYAMLSRADFAFRATKRGLILFILDQDQFLIYTFDFFAESNPVSKGKIIAISPRQLDTISIIINQKAYNKLTKKRKEALKSTILLTEDDDLVPAQIIHNETLYDAEVRLKGDWTDHLDGDQWSFRVKMDDEAAVKGMRKFSLHHPKTRNYAGEWLFHELVKDAGILHLRYDFVQVNLMVENGLFQETKSSHLYALEEFFEKQLIESNQRRAGVILKIDEAPLWQERADFQKTGLTLKELEFVQLSDFSNLNILPYSEKRIRQDSQLFRQFLTGSSLLRGYLNGELAISEVFDIELLAKYNAICNLLGANHALIWHNLRFYYNPINSHLEPIGFDAYPLNKEYYFYTFPNAEKDLMYQEAYIQALQEVTTNEYIRKVLGWQGLEEKWLLLQQHYPEYVWNGADILKHNQGIIQNHLFPAKSLNIFLESFSNNQLQLSIENFGRFPVEILGIENEIGRQLDILPQNTVIAANEKQLLSFTLDGDFSKQFVNKKFQKTGFNIQSDIYKLKINYQTLGTTATKLADIIPWSKDQPLPDNLLKKASTVQLFDFLQVDEANQKIVCPQGNWQITRPLVIPANYTFSIEAGTRLHLTNTISNIISYSPILWKGTKENPIEIFSETEKGQGIIVFNSQDTSIVEYCHFRGLSNPKTHDWVVTGAVNFYKAPVRIQHSSFTNNRSEDGLNIINTYFEMNHVLFDNTASDAFDGDFVEGRIANAVFTNLGNDAIDVSGSSIVVENTAITKAGDKGLSAGESSTVIAQQILVKESEIAVASKDLSIIQLKNVILDKNKLGFTAFQKKSEFGTAAIVADSITLKNMELIYLIEDGSSLRLNGEMMPTSDKVKKLMYGVEFGRSSR